MVFFHFFALGHLETEHVVFILLLLIQFLIQLLLLVEEFFSQAVDLSFFVCN